MENKDLTPVLNGPIQDKAAVCPPDSSYHKHSKTGVWRAALRVLRCHVSGIIFANMLCIILAGFMMGWGLYLAIPVILIIYSLAIYASMWAYGREDLAAAQSHYITLNRLHGLTVCLAGYLPFLIMGALLVLFKMDAFAGVDFIQKYYVVAFKFLNAEIWPIMNAIETSAFLPDISLVQAACMALLTLIPVVIGTVGYLLGTYDFSVTQKLIYKNKEKKTDSPEDRLKKQREDTYMR